MSEIGQVTVMTRPSQIDGDTTGYLQAATCAFECETGPHVGRNSLIATYVEAVESGSSLTARISRDGK